MHRDLLAKRASVTASDAALLAAASVDDDEEVDEDADYVFQRVWCDLTVPQRAAAFALSVCASSWDHGTADFVCGWADLTLAERAAAAELGFSATLWGCCLGPYDADPVCDGCGFEEFSLHAVIYSHESQPVDYCHACYAKLPAEMRVGLYAGNVRSRGAWYAHHPDLVP